MHEWNIDCEQDYQESIWSHIETFGTIKSLRKADEVSSAWWYMMEWWYDYDADHFNEREAYKFFREAQDLGLVPHFFGAAQLRMDESACHPSLTHINGLLLKYIKGCTIASYKPGINLSIEEAEVIS
ncbi:hypothetical protein C0993_011824, partial [Termitomyces sp. T159_Od127]